MPALPAVAGFIRITFDKSHLTTIGERLYGESLELLRELIANAYDADALEVHVTVSPEALTVRDDGSGMDEAGLEEFFRIGSREKLHEPFSPRFRRRRIGQFGIGKFAALAACRRFRVFTQRDGFAAEVTFDAHLFEESENDWRVPLLRKNWNTHRGNGTTVTLEELTKTFCLPDIERAIRERFPLDTPSFALFLNGERIMPRTIPGRKFPIRAATAYGEIRGEIVLPNIPTKAGEPPGIECTVRGVVICRSVFGMDAPLIQRLRGRVEADFLPITSDRSRFITDAPEYAAFAEVMRNELRAIRRQERDMEERRERRQADETLKETLTRMRRAIRRNPDIAPQTVTLSRGGGDVAPGSRNSDEAKTPERDGEIAGGASEDGMENEREKESNEDSDAEPAIGTKEPPPPRVRVKRLRGDAVTARRITIGGMGITCALERCGEDAPAAYTEGGVVFLNMDHSLYKSLAKKGKDILALHLSVLIARQVALMFAEGDARKAFALQERLLADCW